MVTICAIGLFLQIRKELPNGYCIFLYNVLLVARKSIDEWLHIFSGNMTHLLIQKLPSASLQAFEFNEKV